ncbi:hypothetical protein ABGB09_29580 [Streptomyces sp. B8F3]|uniref:hypothetical protein n=1 Tax=Streptomyces sp. B8F3 TaxID=3153573 RepID=UPI00325C5298
MTPTTTLDTSRALRRIRELWGDLLTAIETLHADVWPPRQLAHTLRPDPAADDPLTHRAPLVLREHPAPLNLDALDTAIAIEEDLFGLADTIAAAVQYAGRGGDPRRWEFAGEHGPGSRVHGLHWACVWIDGRLHGEDTGPEPEPDGTVAPALFSPLPVRLADEAHTVVRRAETRLLHTLGLDERHTVIPDRPCPWCGGILTLHTGPDAEPTVTCGTLWNCSAPALFDERGRRTWRWRDLPALVRALEAAAGRASITSA